MFEEPGDVIRALVRFADCYDPKTASLMLVGAATKDPHGDPFGNGFIAHFDERAELLVRMQRVDERARTLLVMWYVQGRPVAHIARALGISRVHCYRVQRRALAAMIDDPKVAGTPARPVDGTAVTVASA